MDKDKQVEILKILAQNEERISELYMAYSERSPENSHFWRLLATEKLMHFGWLRQLYNNALRSPLNFDSDRFDSNLTKVLADYIESKLAEAKKQELTLKKTLEIALKIETFLLESRWFEAIPQDDMQIQLSMERLKNSIIKAKNEISGLLNRVPNE